MSAVAGEMPVSMRCSFAAKAIDFLREIGLGVVIRPGASGFAKNVEIVRGTLHVDPKCRVSALLHEAAHLAVTPSLYRGMMTGDLYASFKAMFELDRLANRNHDDPIALAMMQLSDPEATGWAWAAGKHLGIPDHKIIQSDEYDGEGSLIRMMLNATSYVGINGLSAAGFCVVRPNPYRALPAYPTLAFWLQP